jgi:hypothetical protein
MGWTHYWQREITLPTDKFEVVLHDFQVVLANLDIKLSGADGLGDPVLSEREIIFNGIAGQNCEPFIIKSFEPSRRSPAGTFSYCKTEKMPYDICVQLILIILKQHFGDGIVISSDGSEDDWKQAKDLCQKILQYGIEFKLKEIED